MNGQNLLNIQVSFPHHCSTAPAAERRHPADGPGLHRAVFQEIGQTDHADPEGDADGTSRGRTGRSDPGPPPEYLKSEDA